MGDLTVIAIIAVALFFAVRESVKHFKGEGGCCGGGKTLKSKKRLSHTVSVKTVTIEGMECESCANRVEWAINDIDGLAAKVNLKKKQAVVSMSRDVSDDVIIKAVEKAGYKAIEIK